MDAVSVRETVARDILVDLGISKEIVIYADCRFTLDVPPAGEIEEQLTKEGIDPKKRVIGITTRHMHRKVLCGVKRTHHYSDRTVEHANEVLAGVVADLADLAQLVLIPMHPTHDEDLATANIINRSLEDGRVGRTTGTACLFTAGQAGRGTPDRRQFLRHAGRPSAADRRFTPTSPFRARLEGVCLSGSPRPRTPDFLSSR